MRSALPLPLEPADGSEVALTFDLEPAGVLPAVDGWTPLPGVPLAWRGPTASGPRLRLRYEAPGQWAEFAIDDGGGRVVVHRGEDVPDDELAELLLSQVLSTVLAQRGYACLHAATVRIAGRIVLLLGPSGTGKSTTCAALARGGHEVVGDDVAAVRIDGGVPTVLPGLPRARLRQDAAGELFPGLDLDRVWGLDVEDHPKSYAVFDTTPAPGPLPVDAIYLLEARGREDAAPGLEDVGALEALPLLMAERHMAHVMTADGHRRDFATVGALVARTSTRRLVRPDGLRALPAIVEALVRDVDAG